MNTSITELTVKNNINLLSRENKLPDFLNIPFEMDNGKLGNYKIKANIKRLNYFLKQLKTASRFYEKKTSRTLVGTSSENTIKNQAEFYVSQLKTKELLFYPLKSSMLATSNQFRFETLKRIVPRQICYSGHFSSDARFLQALTESAQTMGYSIKEHID